MVPFNFSFFDYCAQSLGELDGKSDSELQKALNSCVRYVFKIGWRERVTPFRLKLGWMTARNRRLFLASRLLHKTILNERPQYLNNLFKFVERSRPTRQIGEQLIIPFATSKSFFSSFQVVTSKFWNSLPNTIRSANNVDSFKKLLRSFILKNENDDYKLSLNLNSTL